MCRHCSKKIKKNSTTLDVTIVPASCPTQGTKGKYYKLKYGKGDKVVVREELAFVEPDKCQKRIGLAAFVQITDVHIIDSSSPARVAFLAQYIPEFQELQDSFRPQEGLTLQVADAMVRKINSIKKGPQTKCPISFVISTGDNGDGQQKNELQNYINVLDGRKVYPNTATPGRYVGVQDDTPTVNFETFYHPNPGSPDLYKVEYGFPEYPGLLDRAAKPFVPTGLIYPWYTANGNHDCTKLGNYGLNLYSMFKLFDQIATGQIPDVGSKLIQAMSPPLAMKFIEALEKQDTKGVNDVIKASVLRDIPASDKRLQYTRDDFIAMHFNTTICPGPVGHGFDESNRINSTLYYQFEVSKHVEGFVLDTCNPSGNLENPELAPDGSIGRIQLSWLESKLIKHHSSYYDTQGHLIHTKNKNKLCVLFSHHTNDTMGNIFNSLDVVDPDPQKVDGEEFVLTIQRFPNVILWVNGHTHRNEVSPLCFVGCRGQNCKRYDGYEGFWEINTASHVDFPQQSRIVEIADNCDGTLSIFGTIIDHLSPPSLDSCREIKVKKQCNGSYKSDYTITEMASISRELSYNDPFNEPRTRGGKPKDRNVELLINNPLLRKC